MHCRKRGPSTTLWRSSWIPKGVEGNSHGFKRETYIGSLPTTSEAIPAALDAKLTADERALVHRVLVEPARLAAEQRRRQDEIREKDPHWRVAEATRLVVAVAALTAERAIPLRALLDLNVAMARVRTIEPAPISASYAKPGPSPEPLRDAHEALLRANKAVRSGALGRAPSSDVRATRTYKAWSDICGQIAPGNPGNLLDALQEGGWVKKRGS